MGEVALGLVEGRLVMVGVGDSGDTGELPPEDGRGRAFSFCAALLSRT